VINRTESRLIALEQRNQAARSKQTRSKQNGRKSTPLPETAPTRKAG